jgi:transcriptional regulator with GAF, ATPase, and Fis domain
LGSRFYWFNHQRQKIQKTCHGIRMLGVLPIRGLVRKGSIMNVDQAALMDAESLRQADVGNHMPEKTVRLKLAERPDRDRIQRVVDLADALLSEAETLARDKAFTDEATKLKPLDILAGINFYDEVQRFETHLIKMALSETGGNQAKAARLLGIKPTTLNSKIKLFSIEVVETD